MLHFNTLEHFKYPKIYKWWDYQKIINSNKTKEYISKKEALIDLEETLKNAATSCMVSDVPVGCFLSGGIDSSIISYGLKKKIGNLNSFTNYMEPNVIIDGEDHNSDAKAAILFSKDL